MKRFAGRVALVTGAGKGIGRAIAARLLDECIRNCRARPWEPHKYDDPQEQERRLAFLLEWVAAYDTRDDELSGPRHRAIFDAFTGNKRRFGDLAAT